MDIHGFMDIAFMDIHGYPWISTDIYGYLWTSMDIRGRLADKNQDYVQDAH